MSPQLESRGDCRIVYDDAAMPAPRCAWFNPAHWVSQGQNIAGRQMRGGVVQLETPFGQVALKRYFRGGQVARLSADRYLYTGAERSRAFREWRLLHRLREMGLPVPQPLAACCQPSSPLPITCRMALMTRWLPNSRHLAELLAEQVASGEDPAAALCWRQAGRTIRRFHEAGLMHADLNLRNIMLDAAGDIVLLDFDKSRLRPPGAWQQANLDRLQRSYHKVLRELGQAPEDSVHQARWRTLADAYHAGPQEGST